MANAFSKGRPIEPLVVTAEERAYLERQVRRHRVSRSLSERCRIILRCADGLQSKVVAAELGVHEHTVGKWRRRFLADRIDGLLDEARPGRPRTIDDDQVAAVIERTLRTTPADATHWSIRSMATETGFSHTTIRRMWNAFGLQPHRSQTFKLSSDPLFVDKVRDIVGLYLSPPTRAIVLSVDGDPLASTALSIVNNNGTSGVFANELLAGSIEHRDALAGRSSNLPAVWAEVNTIGVELMRAHVAAIGATNGNLSAAGIAQYHFDVFAAHGLPPSTFGGAMVTGTQTEASITSPVWRRYP